jgi:hypothetical protein
MVCKAGFLWFALSTFSGLLWGACPDKSLKKWDPRDLRPTQFAVGYREVDEKRQALEGSDRKGDKFLCENPIPVVLGPDGQAYVIDHHHLGLALVWEKRRTVYVDIRKDWSGEKNASFWEKMRTNGFVYLRDEAGKPGLIQDLPTRLKDMKDDPYRALAYFVRKKGGYKKSRALYAEFQWGEFFRTRVDLGVSDEEFEAAVATGVKLARSSAASHLPGYCCSNQLLVQPQTYWVR